MTFPKNTKVQSMQSYIFRFSKKGANGDTLLIVKAAGAGNNVGEAVESAKNAVKSEYPGVLKTCFCAWTAELHHMKLEPGKLE